MMNNEIAIMQQEEVLILPDGRPLLSNDHPKGLIEVRLDHINYPQLIAIPIELSKKQMFILICTWFTIKGQDISGRFDDIEQIASRVVNDLMADLFKLGSQYITFYEINYAIIESLFGVSGQEMFGINEASIMGVINHYIITKGHKADSTARIQHSHSLAIQASCEKEMSSNEKLDKCSAILSSKVRMTRQINIDSLEERAENQRRALKEKYPY